MATWAPWGTGTQIESGSSLNQSPTGVAGEYVGVSSEATYDFTNKAIQVQIRQLPASTTGVQAYLRCEVDINNGVIIGFGDGNLFAQTHLGGSYATPYSVAWPAGIMGLRITFDNAQNLLWFSTTNNGTTWTSRYSMAMPIATTALKVILASGCYQAVGSPGTTRWEGVNTTISVFEDLTGTADGKATADAAIQPTDLYGKAIYATSGLTAYWRLNENPDYAGVIKKTPGLVGYWRLGETSGTVAADSSGQGGNGTYEGTYTLGQPGAISGDSNGSTGFTAGRVAVPDSAALRTPVGNQWSMEAWVYPNNLSGSKSILRKDAAAGGYFLRQADAELHTLWALSGGTDVQLYGGNFTVSAWNHVVATYDGANIRHYMNGVQVDIQAETRTLAFSTNPMYFGSHGGGGGELMDGKLDEIAIYNTALSAAQVDEHYKVGSGTTLPTLRDSSPAGRHHGIYTGNPGFGQSGAGVIADSSTDFTGANDTAGWPEVFPLSGSFTLECWVKADTWVHFASIFNRRRWEVSEGGIVLEVRDSAGLLDFNTADPVAPRAAGDGYIYAFIYSTSWGWVSTPTPLTAGEWHHIAYAYDQSVTTIWLYIDGVFVAGSPDAGVLNNPTTNVSTQIGRNVEYGHLFDGKIDEMALYNRSLSAQEIADHYTLATAAPGLITSAKSDGKATCVGVVDKGALPTQIVGPVDTFSIDGFLDPQWTGIGTLGVRSVASGVLNLGAPASTPQGYVGVQSAIVNLSDKIVFAQIVARPSTVTGSATYLRVEDSGASNWGFEIGTNSTYLMGSVQEAGTYVYSPFVAWPNTPLVVRMLFDPTSGGHRVYFQYSSDGITWTTLGSYYSTRSISSWRVILRSNAGNIASPGTAQWDNVNTAFWIYRNLTASTAGSSTTTATLTRRRSLTAASAGSSTATGVISKKKAIPTVSSAGVATTSATISRKRALVAASAGVASVLQALTRKRALVAASAGVAVSTGTTTRKRLLVATSTGSSSAAGVVSKAPQFKNLTGVATGVATIGVGAGSAFSDNFNRADGAPGGNWSGALEILSNQGHMTGFSAQYALNSTVVGTPDYDVQVDLNPGALVNGGAIGLGLVARYQDVNNFYLLWLDQGATSAILYEVVGGSYNAIDTGSYTITNPVTVKLSCQGTTIKGYIGGVEIVSATNSTHTAEGDFGMRAFNPEDSNLVGHRWDNFQVLVAGAGGITQISAKRRVTGSSAGIATVFVQLSTKRRLLVASAGISTVAGQLTSKRRLVAASAGVATATGVITKRLNYKDLPAGTSTGGSTATATITRRRSLVVASSGVATASGTLVAKRTLVAASVGSSVTLVSLTRRRYLAAVSTGTSTATGTVSKQQALKFITGTAAGVSTASGTLTVRRALTATSVGTSTASGSAKARRSLVAASTGVSTSSGAVRAKRRLLAISTGVATATAAPVVTRRLVAASNGVATASGNLQKLGASTFPTARATADAQKLVATIKTGAVFGAALMSGSAQASVANIIPTVTFPASLSTANATISQAVMRVSTGWQAQLMQSTASAFVSITRISITWPATLATASVQSLMAEMRISTGILAQVATVTCSASPTSMLAGVRIFANLATVSLQGLVYSPQAGAKFLAQSTQVTVSTFPIIVLVSGKWLAQPMQVDVMSFPFTYTLGVRWIPGVMIVNGLMRIATWRESFAITSPGPDIIWSENVVPLIVSSGELVPFIVGSEELVPMIVGGKSLLPYLYRKDELVPIIVSSDEA